MREASPTIWVVDDMEDMIYAFTSVLIKKTSFVLSYVATAREVQAKPGDIVFLDLHGTDAKNLRVPSGVKVILMTGSTKDADLYKPFSSQQLQEIIDTVERQTASNAAKKAA